ncbi:MAG: calcium-binding protein [Myxococcota bacterium]
MKPGAAVAAAVIVVLSVGTGAHAFEPYTHNFTADQARADALDGFVTIQGREYPLRPEVAAAIRDWPAFYDAGVIGPDIYPDLLYGWNLIHTSEGSDVVGCETDEDPPRFFPGPGCVRSGNTGDWLALVLARAWLAQRDARYGAVERAQILAYAYGFLTHAAGDLWAHTFVNDFAQQLWPPTSEVLTDSFALSVALRHKAVEAYMADATRSYDGNPERTVLAGGDISDDSTPHRAFDAPHRFMYEVLINPSAPTPAGGEREVTIGFFLGLRAALVQTRADIPRPIADTLEFLLDEHDRFIETFLDADDLCRDDADGIFQKAKCAAALAAIAAVELASRAEYLVFRDNWLADSAEGILARYLDNWIHQIDVGLANWGKLGLALNRAYFDPQVRRDLQNRPGSPGCGNRGPDALAGPRADCEDAVSRLDVIVDETNDFVNDHLLSMLGAPPVVGRVRSIRQDFRALFDDAIGPLVNPVQLVVNPLIAAVDEVRADARRRVREHLEERFGVDVDDLEAFSNGAAHWLALETVTVTAPVLGTQTFTPLFEVGDHALIDELLRLPTDDHHVPSDPPHPNAGGLGDDVCMDPMAFQPVHNTIALAKLLLLDGEALDRALGDILVEAGVWQDASTIRTYQGLTGPFAPANVMVQALVGTPWLRSITSDHAWREDAEGRDFTVFDHVKGGTGQFPVWESCVLRPAFRELFTDWENGAENFPDLGDVPSPDPASNPAAPGVELTIEGRTFDDGSTLFVGHDNVLTLTASDPTGFPSTLLGLRYRVRPAGGPLEEMVETGPEATFSIEGPDGLYLVEYQSADPCHTFVDENGDGPGDPLPPGPLETIPLVLAHIGTEGPDRIIGTDGDDILLGLGGRDQLIGRAGNDEIRGGPGGDLLHGHNGDDLLLGEEGDDRLIGNNGDDTLFGGPGDDRLAGNVGADALDGGADDDRLHGGPGVDGCVGGGGSDRILRCEPAPGKGSPGRSRGRGRARR